MGANNCTNIKSTTIGIKTSSRRRMIFPRTPLVTYHSRQPLSRILAAHGTIGLTCNFSAPQERCGNKFELHSCLSNQKGKVSCHDVQDIRRYRGSSRYLRKLIGARANGPRKNCRHPEEGIATIPLVKSGPHLLAIDYRGAPSGTPELAAADLYNPTLWFFVCPPAGAR
jgi:hypothetical protein